MNVRIKSTGAMVHKTDNPYRDAQSLMRTTACDRRFDFLGFTKTNDEVDCMACIAART